VRPPLTAVLLLSTVMTTAVAALAMAVVVAVATVIVVAATAVLLAGAGTALLSPTATMLGRGPAALRSLLGRHATAAAIWVMATLWQLAPWLARGISGLLRQLHRSRVHARIGRSVAPHTPIRLQIFVQRIEAQPLVAERHMSHRCVHYRSVCYLHVPSTHIRSKLLRTPLPVFYHSHCDAPDHLDLWLRRKSG